MKERNASSFAPALVLILLVALAGYVGSYFILAEVVYPYLKRPWNEDRYAALFLPVHQVDRQVRRGYWNMRDFDELIDEIITTVHADSSVIGPEEERPIEMDP